MVLDMDSDAAAESERVLFGWFWELRNIEKNNSKFKGITLHRTYLEHNLIVPKMTHLVNSDYIKDNMQTLPESYYHSFSPFQICAKNNFYNFIKDFEAQEKNKGVFVSSYPLSNIFNYLDDFNEFKERYDNLDLTVGLILEETRLYQRISEDTRDWNRLLLK